MISETPVEKTLTLAAWNAAAIYDSLDVYDSIALKLPRWKTLLLKRQLRSLVAAYPTSRALSSFMDDYSSPFNWLLFPSAVAILEETRLRGFSSA